MNDKTRIFSDKENEEITNKMIFIDVYNSLKMKGYNPIQQIVGYLLTEDPTYITSYNNARQKIVKIDRDELLREMVLNYIQN